MLKSGDCSAVTAEFIPFVSNEVDISNINCLIYALYLILLRLQIEHLSVLAVLFK